MELIVIVFILFADQFSKHAAIKYLKGNRPHKIVEDFFQFNYVENRGAAFGILEHKRLFFIIITLIIIIVLSLYLIKYYDNLSAYTKVAFSMLIGGALGNLIDRIRFGYVVDFISFKLKGYYNFPVFNIADIFIVVSTMLIIFVIMFDKVEV